MFNIIFNIIKIICHMHMLVWVNLHYSIVILFVKKNINYWFIVSKYIKVCKNENNLNLIINVHFYDKQILYYFKYDNYLYFIFLINLYNAMLDFQNNCLHHMLYSKTIFLYNMLNIFLFWWNFFKKNRSLRLIVV